MKSLSLLCIGTFWGAIADDIKAVDPPSGFQGIKALLKLYKLCTCD